MATNLPGVGLPSAKRYYLQRRPQYKHRESYQRDLSAVPQLIDGSPMDEKAQKARQRLEQKLGFFYSSYRSYCSADIDGRRRGKHGMVKKYSGKGLKSIGSTWLSQLYGCKNKRIYAQSA